MNRHKTCQVTLVIYRRFAVIDLMHVVMSFTPFYFLVSGRFKGLFVMQAAIRGFSKKLGRLRPS